MAKEAQFTAGNGEYPGNLIQSSRTQQLREDVFLPEFRIQERGSDVQCLLDVVFTIVTPFLFFHVKH
jgi:hypothetical protein